MLNKLLEEKIRFHANLQNYVQKVKDLEAKLQQVPLTAPEESKALRKSREIVHNFLFLKRRDYGNLKNNIDL